MTQLPNYTHIPTETTFELQSSQPISIEDSQIELQTFDRVNIE